jgi:branched-chain amino acid transport system ATP-binding protein
MREPSPLIPALSAHGVTHRYGAIRALDDVSIDIARGAFVAVLGSNGAGKSTLAYILSGLILPTRGNVAVNGAIASGRHSGPLAGVRLVPEGRRLFGQLTVTENLLLGGYGGGASDQQIKSRLPAVLEGLPKVIRENPSRVAATLSGGEQQMLAIGRALMAEPDILIIDEPSMGLAPILIAQVYAALSRLHKSGVTIVLLEQMATQAVKHTDQLVILDRGRVIYTGPPDTDTARSAITEGYIGGGRER